MNCVPVGATRWLRWGCLGLAAVVAFLAATSDPADARQRRKRSHARLASASSSYNPPYAAIVVDANNGSVLHASNPDAPRHPASLTKIMTLYLLFEQLEAGKIKLDTPMDVSEEASSQAPTKLGLKPGDTLKVEDAIKGLVTKSANDAAVVVAEALGGSVDDFARSMTRKARALGMKNTTYRNPNGLPNDEQITTARDQALLGIAIQERFPKYYRYFSIASFVYRGNAMRNHNHLLGAVEGVDGIKTGYTRDSGFNLVTSIKRGARRMVAVVLGGRSASSRDARMRELISEHIAEASTKAPNTQVAAGPKAEAPPMTKPQLASAETTPLAFSAPTANETAVLAPGSTAPITPVKVKTVTVKLVTPRGAPAGLPAPVSEPTRTAALSSSAQEQALVQSLAAATPVETASPAPEPATSPAGLLGKLPAAIAAAKESVVPTAKAEAAPAAVHPPKAAATPLAKIAVATPAPAKIDEAVPSAPSRQAVRAGWAIQVGAYEDQGEAKQHLSAAKGTIAQVARKAEAYIERTVKGAKTYYRARFAGFDRNQAEAACKRLKREDVACMALKI